MSEVLDAWGNVEASDFEVVRLPPGRYVLRFSAAGVAPEYYDDASMPALATVIDVDYDDVVTGIDAVLTVDGPPPPPAPAPKKVVPVKAPGSRARSRSAGP